jgi:crotonobetainyl-CoA:carnitine CoA-transferase CaiB-like acyl-CoA transferase
MVGATQEEIDRLSAPIGKFFLSHTKSELYEGAQKRQLMLYPVLTIEDIRQSPQLASRNFWRSLDHPELGGPISYPGSIAQGSVISCEPRFRAPRIGEHNSEIYAELGFKKENLLIMKEAGII